jgi:ATP-dependent Lon protease
MDRMEIIRIAGYTEDEKVEIAKRHLLPNAMVKHGLDAKEWVVEDSALMELVRRYTREAGVRNLEREISNLARKAVKDILTSKKKKIVVDAATVADYLGPPKFRYGEIEAEDQVGLVTGLAWTEVGGELLTIEGVMMPGKGRMTVTGNLKDVMKESISAAASYVRSRAVDFGVEPPVFDRRDIHVHVPEGATPKDGPSAGVAMATAIVSIVTGIPVRSDLAMTGEITLRGRVLPIGGLKEKLLAALRGERQGSGRHPGRCEKRPRDRAGGAHGGSAPARPHLAAHAHRLGRGCGGAGETCGAGRGRHGRSRPLRSRPHPTRFAGHLLPHAGEGRTP